MGIIFYVSLRIGTPFSSFSIMHPVCVWPKLCQSMTFIAKLITCSYVNYFDGPSTLNFIEVEKWAETEELRLLPPSHITRIRNGIFHCFGKQKSTQISTGLTAIRRGDSKNAAEMTTLWLQNNRIEIVPHKVFEGANNVRNIRLWANRIHTIEDFAFDGLNKLEYIFLNNNSLVEIKRNAFAGGLNNNIKASSRAHLIRQICTTSFWEVIDCAHWLTTSSQPHRC